MRPKRPPLVAVVLLAAFTFVVRPGATAGAATCAEPTPDHVAVVIDFGTLADAPSGITAECVPFARRATGMDVLRSVAPGQVATDSSGKVCAILGYPADPSSTNCSAPQDGRIRYWAYFLGTAGGWTYSASGAAAIRATPDVVQGWRFIDVPASGGTADIAPPRDYSGSPSNLWSTTCPAAPAPTTRPAGTLPSGAPVTTAAPSGAVHPATSSGATTTSTTARVPTSLANGAIEGLRSTARVKRLTPAEVRAATAGSPSKGSPLGEVLAIVAGLVVIAGLLAAAMWRSRRRTAQD